MTVWKIIVLRWDCPHDSCDLTRCRKANRRSKTFTNPQEAIDILERQGQLTLEGTA